MYGIFIGNGPVVLLFYQEKVLLESYYGGLLSQMLCWFPLITFHSENSNLYPTVKYANSNYAMEKVKNILLIDDDDIINLLNRKLIERLEIADNIKVFRNGMEGINYFSILCQLDTCPELIFLDLNMPQMNGFQFLEAYHKLPYKNKAEAKIIILSSSEDPSDIKKALLLGCDEYLTKPLNKNQIIEVVDKYFNLVE